MKHILTILLTFAFLSGFSQVQTGVRQKINVKGYDYKEIAVDSLLRFPRDTLHLRTADSGSVVVKISDGKYVPWVWTGYKWDSLATGGSGGIANVLAGLGIVKTGDTVKSTYPVIASLTALRAAATPLSTNAYRARVGGQLRDYLYNASDNSTVDDSVINIRSAAGGTYTMQYDYIDPLWFGATPDDGTDDSRVINKAIQFAIKSTKSHRVYFSTIGVYNVSNLVVANYSGGQSQQVSLTMEGANASAGAGVYFRNVDKASATLHVQTAKNVFIRNIVFEGASPTNADFVAATESDWTASGTVRSNINSPHAAISIDGLFTGSGTTLSNTSDRYPNMTEWYTNTHYEGTTDLIIENCTFGNFYVVISQGLSGCPNGENIVLRNGVAHDSRTFWAAGQLQSRVNRIENFYFYGGNTFISNRFGTGLGDVPSIYGGNINYLKQLYDVYGSFTHVSFSGGYSEGIWSFGRATTKNPVTFTDWKSTMIYSNGSGSYQPSAPVLAEGDGSFNYVGGELLSYNYQPMPFNVQQVNIGQGTHITAGLIFITNPNWFDKVKLDGVVYVGYGTAESLTQEGIVFSGQSEATMNNHILLPGSGFVSYTGRKYENVGQRFDKIGIESAVITVNTGTQTATFTASNSGKYQLGDNLYADEAVDDASDIYASTATSIGFVTGKSGSTITLSYIPKLTSGGTYTISIVRIPNFITRTLGNVTSGSNSITGALIEDATFPVGAMIKGDGIPVGARVTNVVGTTITMSVNATATATAVELYDARIKVTGGIIPFNYFGNTSYDAVTLNWFKGDEIKNLAVGAQYASRICITAGQMGNVTYPPLFFTGSPKTPFNGTQTSVGAGVLGFQGLSIGQSFMGNNVYFDGTNYRYVGTGYATELGFFNGALYYQTAPSGTAGTVVTPTNVFGIANDGSMTVSANSTFPLSVMGKTTYSYISINGSYAFASPIVGINFDHAGVTRWQFTAGTDKFSFFNGTLNKDALTLDTATSKATFYALASYNKNENGVMTNFSIPNKKYVDSTFALGAVTDTITHTGSAAQIVWTATPSKIVFRDIGATGADDMIVDYGADSAIRIRRGHSRGTPASYVMFGGGTSPTVTVTGNDVWGKVEIVTGASGSFGILNSFLTFASAYSYTPAVHVTAGSSSMIDAHVFGFTANGTGINIGTSLVLAPSTTYTFYYSIPQ